MKRYHVEAVFSLDFDDEAIEATSESEAVEKIEESFMNYCRGLSRDELLELLDSACTFEDDCEVYCFDEETETAVSE